MHIGEQPQPEMIGAVSYYDNDMEQYKKFYFNSEKFFVKSEINLESD